MHTRIFSTVVCRALALAVLATGMSLFGGNVNAQVGSGSGYYTDPSTGIVYQKVTKTVERPVVETMVQQRQQTVFRPQTVTETTPQSRTIYTPVLEYTWEPRVHGRWNPFQRPTVAYHHVGRTHWEPRNEVIEKTQTRTEWVAEKRTIDVPQRIVRMQREEKVDYEVVGRVAPQASPPGPSSAIASRLRPLDSGSSVTTFSPTNSYASAYSSDPPRTAGQSGMRATELSPTAPIAHGQPLPGGTGGVGIATTPTLPFFR